MSNVKEQVSQEDKTNPIIHSIYGHRYPLYLGYEKTVEGFYIGLLPARTLPWHAINKPEGHTFARRQGESIELFCTKSEEQLRMAWLSDGEDGPCWPVGIPVSRVDSAFSQAEMNYLLARLNQWEANARR